MFLINPYRLVTVIPPGSPVAFGAIYSDDYTTVETAYPSLEKDATTIEGLAGVGTPGIVTIGVSYVNTGFGSKQILNADTTDAEVFWSDVLNYLYAQNLPGITYSPPVDKWFPDDTDLTTFIVLSLQ